MKKRQWRRRKPRAQLRPAERAWREHVVTRPCPLRWADLAEELVDSLKPKRRDATLALVLLCLDLASDWDDFLDGRWMSQVTVHRYIYFDGSGFGDARTLQWLSKLVRWLRDQQRITEEDAAWLLSNVDDARESVGLERVHGPRLRDHAFRFEDLASIAAEFGESIDDGYLRDLAWPAVRVIAVHAPGSRGYIRFGGLQVEWLLETLLTPDEARSTTDVVGSSRTLLDIAAQLYRWLGLMDYLDEARASRIASELGMAAFRLAA